MLEFQLKMYQDEAQLNSRKTETYCVDKTAHS